MTCSPASYRISCPQIGRLETGSHSHNSSQLSGAQASSVQQASPKPKREGSVFKFNCRCNPCPLTDRSGCKGDKCQLPTTHRSHENEYLDPCGLSACRLVTVGQTARAFHDRGSGYASCLSMLSQVRVEMPWPLESGQRLGGRSCRSCALPCSLEAPTHFAFVRATSAALARPGQ